VSPVHAVHDPAPGAADPAPETALVDALTGLHLQGAFFLQGRYTEGWAYRSVPSADAVAILSPGSPRVILFHVIAAGRCWIEVDGDAERRWAEAGDVVVLPYGDGHRMGGTADAELVEIAALMPPPPWDEMPVIVHGSGGELTRILCGYLTSRDLLFDPGVRALPPLFVSRPTGAAAAWVRASIDFVLGQSTKADGIHYTAPTPIIELVLIEVLKLHLASAPTDAVGLVRALRDPVVGSAMALIHADPARKWSVAALAAELHVSVSLLDERFRNRLGMPPIRYLTGWRMHVAQDLLAGTALGVAAIARRTGYESEEAFSRAFKRKCGVAPSVWRRSPG